MFRWLSVVAVFAFLFCEPNILQGAENEDPLGEEIDRLAERIKDLEDDVLKWIGRNGHLNAIDVEQVSEDLVSGLRLPSLVDEKYHERLRRDLSSHRKKLLRFRRGDPDLVGLDVQLKKIEEAERIEPKEGLYHVQIKGKQLRTYTLEKFGDRYEVKLVDSGGANTRTSFGMVSWKADDAVWTGPLSCTFWDEPPGRVYQGEITLVPLGSTVFNGEQTWHRGRLKLMHSSIKWVWFRPLP